MDVQNNKTCQYERFDKVKDSNKPLNNNEIYELKRIFKLKCFESFIDSYSRKNYNLFIKNIIFEPNINNTDDLYYLGVYYQYIKKDYDLMEKYFLMATEKGNFYAANQLGIYYTNIENYDLMKKYYLQAIEKGDTWAMKTLGLYYRCKEKNYNLMEKYYLMAIEKGDYHAMNQLGLYYQNVGNYDLMKKYYLQAIEKGDILTMVRLGQYYKFKEKNNDLMKKYYLMAISKENNSAIFMLDQFYEHNVPNGKDLQNYFNAIIKGNFRIKDSLIFRCNKYIRKYGAINMFCLNIDNIDINIENFRFCLSKIVHYIKYRKSYKLCESCESKNVKHFVRYINKLYYGSKNILKYKLEYKKCTNEILMINASQIFMEYLDLHYYEYLKKIFASGGDGYTKTKNHFELITKQ
jgi:TPR repeat protein